MAKQLLGDVNNDGKLSTIDMRIIFEYRADGISLDEDEIKRADVNGDGSITLVDARSILQHISGRTLIEGVIE